MLYARISAERIGVLIGPEGTTKERLQKATGTRISVDSTTGDVTIDEAQAQDPVLALKAKDIIQAMARGFSEDRAFRLLDEDAYFEVFDIKDFAHSRNRVAQIRARLIGTRGKTRRLIEELTGVEVSVWGHTIALIGGTFEMAIAREAVFMLLRGSEHKTVYPSLPVSRSRRKPVTHSLGRAGSRRGCGSRSRKPCPPSRRRAAEISAIPRTRCSSPSVPARGSRCPG